MFGNFENLNFLICFRRFDWKSDTRHSFLEFVAKSGRHFIKNSQKKCKIRREKSKRSEIQLLNREKMLTIFGRNFEIWAVQKYVNLVDLVKSFQTSIYLQKSASIQPRTSLSKFIWSLSYGIIKLSPSRPAPCEALEHQPPPGTLKTVCSDDRAQSGEHWSLRTRLNKIE